MYFEIERIKKLNGELQTYIYPNMTKVKYWKIKKGSFKGGESCDSSDWEHFDSNNRWGGFKEEDRHFWFRTDIEIPSELDGKKVLLHVSTCAGSGWDLPNPQLLAYVNGELVQGLDTRHRDIMLSENAAEGEIYTVALFAYCGMRGGLVELNTEISGIDENTEGLYFDIKTPLDVADLLDKEDKRRIDILKFLTNAVNMLDLRKPYSTNYDASVIRAREYLQIEFYENFCGGSDINVVCVGHTHIDTAWLWTLSQTREKVVRSFSTVLNLMKKYPEYTFFSSQPQLYEYLKEEAPELYEQVKERIREGRWEPEGAMWVEADCNITGGESLVRQIMLGKRFFKNEFGIDSEILWLPDTFGFSASLPQILAKTGVRYFLASKLGWNEYHEMPYDSFMWRGIDGTEVLTHFITAQSPTFMPTPHAVSYNGRIDAPHLMSAWGKYQQKPLHNEVFMAFGYGDGGGGPTKEMLEEARRFEKGIPGCPKSTIAKAGEFFSRLKTSSDNSQFPKWVGELYLERCRGTLTSMGRSKRNNRKSEFLYQDAELWTMAANSLLREPYPKEELEGGWKSILLNQFHDILPGSAIKEVYEDSDRDYAYINETGRKVLNTAQRVIAANISLDINSVIVFNQLSGTRSGVVFVEIPKELESEDLAGIGIFDGEEQMASQKSADGRIAFLAKNVPGKGYKAFALKKCSKPTQSISMAISHNTIDNRFFRIELDENANITSIYDKRNGREVLKHGMRGNVLQAFEDKPYDYDAWEISIFYEEKMWEINKVESISVVENGPVFARLRVVKNFSDSKITQDIVVYNDIQRVDFETIIDWNERQVLLKAAFPVDVHADKATYEIQYGALERPTHKNTSWDVARFEVCAHKWADLSEAGYGVSLLNDCKYGHDIHDNVMRLTLLKTPIDPYDGADREVHRFTYSLYPHAGDWRDGGTIAEAYDLNCPLQAIYEPAHAGVLKAEFSLVSSSARNVLIEVVKQAEDSGDIVLRVYESEGRRTKASLSFYVEILNAWECDMLENNISDVSIDGNCLELEIKPFEIKTFKVREEKNGL